MWGFCTPWDVCLLQVSHCFPQCQAVVTEGSHCHLWLSSAGRDTHSYQGLTVTESCQKNTPSLKFLTDINTTQLFQALNISVHRSVLQAPAAHIVGLHQNCLKNVQLKRGKYSGSALCMTFWGWQSFHRAVRTGLALP